MRKRVEFFLSLFYIIITILLGTIFIVYKSKDYISGVSAGTVNNSTSYEESKGHSEVSNTPNTEPKVYTTNLKDYSEEHVTVQINSNNNNNVAQNDKSLKNYKNSNYTQDEDDPVKQAVNTYIEMSQKIREEQAIKHQQEGLIGTVQQSARESVEKTIDKYGNQIVDKIAELGGIDKEEEGYEPAREVVKEELKSLGQTTVDAVAEVAGEVEKTVKDVGKAVEETFKNVLKGFFGGK